MHMQIKCLEMTRNNYIIYANRTEALSQTTCSSHTDIDRDFVIECTCNGCLESGKAVGAQINGSVEVEIYTDLEYVILLAVS